MCFFNAFSSGKIWEFLNMLTKNVNFCAKKPLKRRKKTALFTECLHFQGEGIQVAQKCFVFVNLDKKVLTTEEKYCTI